MGQIPLFVDEKYRLGEYSGSLDGAVLLFDISGFTALAERLSASGPGGAETLSGILNGLYSDGLHRLITDSGGFVNCFSGDSFTVILPESTLGKAEKLLSEVMAGLQSASLGSMTPLSFRAGLSLGRLCWRLSRTERTWFFYGDAVLEASKGNIEAAGSVGGSPENHSRSGGVSGEFRRVFPVFAAAPEGNADDLALFMDQSVAAAHRAGGFFGGVHFDGKGPYVMALFGAPWSHGDNGARALGFIRDLQERCECTLAAGITSGTAFAGHIGFPERNEYTAIGSQVNTAARIMRHARSPRAFMSAEALAGIPGAVAGGRAFPMVLRGKSESVSVVEADRVSLREPGRFQTTLAGREAELRTFASACSRQDTRCITVSGGAGIGKSHLAWQATASLVESGWRRIALQCSDMSEGLFEPARCFLRELKGIEDGSFFQSLGEALPSGGEQRDLDAGAGCLAALMGLPGETPEDPKAKFELTLAALRALFIALASREPTVVLLEDYQWADSGTSELFGLLTREKIDGLLVVFTVRTGDDSIPSTQRRVRDGFVEIALDPLKPGAVIELFSEIAGLPPDEALGLFLQERTGGNPLFAEQYSRYLTETCSIAPSGGKWELIVEPGEIPLGIADVLQARLDRVPKDVRRAVLTASVLGTEFSSEVLQEMNVSHKSSIIAAGQDLHLWIPSSHDRWVFTHGLLREAAYSLLLCSRRKELHSAAVKAIEKLYPDSPEHFGELARHCELSEDLDRAVFYLDKAAVDATANYSLVESLDYRRRLLAITAIPGHENLDLEASSRLEEMMLLTRLNRWNEGLEAATSAERSAVEAGDDRLLGEVVAFTGWILIRKGLIDQAEEAIRRGMEISRQAGDTVRVARALGYLGAVCFSRSDFTEAEEFFSREMELLDIEDSSRDRFMCISNLGCVCKDTGRNDEAEKYLCIALELAEKHANPDYLSIVLGNRSALYRNMGRFHDSLADYNRAVEIAQRTGDSRSLSVLIGGAALVYYDLGNLDEALKLYRRQLVLCRDLDWKMGIAEANGYMAACLEAMGRTSEALECYTECLSFSSEIGIKYYRGIFSVLKAGLLYKAGRYSEARACNEEGQELCSEIGVPGMVLSAKLLLHRLNLRECTDGESARREIAELRRLADEQSPGMLKAIAAHSLWKALTELPGDHGSEVSRARIEALGVLRSSLSGDPNYEELTMLRELEGENGPPVEHPGP